MQVEIRPNSSLGYRFESLFALIAALVLLVAPVRAANVTVGCPGGSGGTYSSITAALAAIGPTGPHTITVTGTCAENVTLFNARSILITAPTPGGATVVGPLDNDTFYIFLSQDITLQNLEIRGNASSSSGIGVYICDFSHVGIEA